MLDDDRPAAATKPIQAKLTPKRDEITGTRHKPIMKNPPSISDMVGLRMGHGSETDVLSSGSGATPAQDTLSSIHTEHDKRIEAAAVHAKFPPGCPVVYLSSPTSITSGKVLSVAHSKSSDEPIYTIVPASFAKQYPPKQIPTVAAPQSSVHFHPSCPVRINMSKASSLVTPDSAILMENSSCKILAGYARLPGTSGTGAKDREGCHDGEEEGGEGGGPSPRMLWAYSVRISLQAGGVVTYHGINESILTAMSSNNDDHHDTNVANVANVPTQDSTPSTHANDTVNMNNNGTNAPTQDSTHANDRTSRNSAPTVIPSSKYASRPAVKSFDERAKKKGNNVAHIRRIDIPFELVTPKHNLIALAKRYLDHSQGRHLTDLIRDLERRVSCRIFLYDQAAKKQTAQHIRKLCGDLSPRHDDVCIFLRARDAPTVEWGTDKMARIFADAVGRNSDDARYLTRKMLSSVAATTMVDSRFHELPPSLDEANGGAPAPADRLSGSSRPYDAIDDVTHTDDLGGSYHPDTVTPTPSNKRTKTAHPSYPTGTVYIRRIEIPRDLYGNTLRTAILGSGYAINTLEADLQCRISFFHEKKRNIRWDDMAKCFDSLCPRIGDLCILVRGQSPTIADEACDIMIDTVVRDLGRRRRRSKDLERELVRSIRTATVIDGGFTVPTSGSKALISRIDLPDWLDSQEVASALIGPRGQSVSRLMKVSNCTIKVNGKGVRDVCADPNADTLYVTFEGNTEEKMSMAYELVQNELLKHVEGEQHDRLLYDLEASCLGHRTASLMNEGGPTVYQNCQVNGRKPNWMSLVSIPWQQAEEIRDYLRSRYTGMSEESGCEIQIFGVGTGGKYKYHPYLLVSGDSERQVDHGVALIRECIRNF